MASSSSSSSVSAFPRDVVELALACAISMRFSHIYFCYFFQFNRKSMEHIFHGIKQSLAKSCPPPSAPNTLLAFSALKWVKWSHCAVHCGLSGYAADRVPGLPRFSLIIVVVAVAADSITLQKPSIMCPMNQSSCVALLEL